MSTIASLLDPTKLAQLVELGEQVNTADAPADVAPARLVDAICAFCGVDLKIELPTVGTISCEDCGTERTRGKAGKRYVKLHMNLSNYTDAQIGAAVRQRAMELEVRRMTKRR